MQHKEFKSRFHFEEKVNVTLAEGVIVQGEVSAVKFLPGKVLYDIRTEYEVLADIDSALVGETVEVPA